MDVGILLQVFLCTFQTFCIINCLNLYMLLLPKHQSFAPGTSYGLVGVTGNVCLIKLNMANTSDKTNELLIEGELTHSNTQV